MGKLIVIEGLDGCGKSTQLSLLEENLKKNGVDCRSVSFPDYEHASSTLVKQYLAGEFGNRPEDVGAYAASAFYAVDRYASFKKYWGNYYLSGGTVIAGRYVTSNAVHQASKLDPAKWEEYLAWLYDFEYEKMGIPKPDAVLFLDMPIEISQKLMSGRYGGNEQKKDIHERDLSYLEHCRRAALFTARYSGWQILPCAENGQARSIQEIAVDILARVLPIVRK